MPQQRKSHKVPNQIKQGGKKAISGFYQHVNGGRLQASTIHIFHSCLPPPLSMRQLPLPPQLSQSTRKDKSHLGEKGWSLQSQRTEVRFIYISETSDSSPLLQRLSLKSSFGYMQAGGLGCGITTQRQSGSLYSLYFVLSIRDQGRVRGVKDAQQGED